MNDLQEMFNTPRTVTDTSGQVWFAAVDVARALGYSKTRDAILKHCLLCIEFKQIKPQASGQMDALKVSNKMIPESDVHRLIVNSNKPEAKKYEAWLFEEVLPSIREKGVYIAPDADTVELESDLRNIKATRRSIDKMRNQLIETSYEVLKDELTEKEASAYIQNVTDQIYIVALLKTASYIRKEQIDKGGEIGLTTTNQLRAVEQAKREDYVSAINYLNEDDLTEVQRIMRGILVDTETMNKARFIKPTVSALKAYYTDKLAVLFNMIPDEVKEQYKHQMVHFGPVLKEVLNDVGKRDDKRITKADQQYANDNIKVRRATLPKMSK